MTEIDWNLLPTFLAVVNSGSLSGAARSLKISQPTVGRQIETLESQLGVTLFTRAPRGLTPTEAAQAILEYAEEMKVAATSLSLAAAGISDQVAGTVRITASEVVATYVLPAMLAAILRDEPRLDLELVASDRTDDLLLREADIAVRMVRPVQPDLISKHVGDLPLGLFAHEDLLARYGPVETLEGFRRMPFVGLDRSTLLIEGMTRLGVHAERSDFRFRSDDQAACLEAVAAGVGMGVSQVHLMAGRPGMVRVLPDLELPELPIWLTANRELRSAARVRRVFDELDRMLTALTRNQSPEESRNTEHG